MGIGSPGEPAWQQTDATGIKWLIPWARAASIASIRFAFNDAVEISRFGA